MAASELTLPSLDARSTHRLIFLYSPVWIAAVALVMWSGWLKRWSDGAYLLFGLALVAPPVLVALRRRGYALKLNLWLWIFSFIGNFFLTAYFFDLLGMGYGFPTRWNLMAREVGKTSQSVPFFLYLMTHCYFLTYHAFMLTVLGWVRRTPLGRSRVAVFATVLLLAYAVAFAETYTMASPLLADYFWYRDRSRMLLLGSVYYASYFVVSVPMLERLDEPSPSAWSYRRVALDALAAGMLVFLLLEAAAIVIGPL